MCLEAQPECQKTWTAHAYGKRKLQGATGSVWAVSVAFEKVDNVSRGNFPLLGFRSCGWSLPWCFRLGCVACSWLLLAGWAWGYWRWSGFAFGVFLFPAPFCFPEDSSVWRLFWAPTQEPDKVAGTPDDSTSCRWHHFRDARSGTPRAYVVGQIVRVYRFVVLDRRDNEETFGFHKFVDAFTHSQVSALFSLWLPLLGVVLLAAAQCVDAMNFLRGPFAVLRSWNKFTVQSAGLLSGVLHLAHRTVTLCSSWKGTSKSTR